MINSRYICSVFYEAITVGTDQNELPSYSMIVAILAIDYFISLIGGFSFKFDQILPILTICGGGIVLIMAGPKCIVFIVLF